MSFRDKKRIRFMKDESGQGTVEAAFILPILMLLVLLLIQPGVILYDYIVMRNAAAEACRLIATSEAGSSSASIEFIEHRLSAIPQQDFFHVHSPECSWYIQVDGSEMNTTAEVYIENQIKPLPLFDGVLTLLEMCNSQGCLDLGVSWFAVNQPDWVGQSAGYNPDEWVESW